MSLSEPVTLLVVEDNPSEARFLEAVLSSCAPFRYKLRFAESLTAARKLLAREPVDGVLLDLGLPDSGGLDTLAQVRQVTKPHVAIIVLTVTDDNELALSALRMGAQDYLVKKEVESSHLARSVRWAVERQRHGAVGLGLSDAAG